MNRPVTRSNPLRLARFARRYGNATPRGVGMAAVELDGAGDGLIVVRLQLETDRLIEQAELCESYASKNAITPRRMILFTGSAGDPRFLELIQRTVEEGWCRAIVCTQPDRLFRSTTRARPLLAAMDAAGVELHAVWNGPYLGRISTGERDRIRQRVTDALDEIATRSRQPADVIRSRQRAGTVTVPHLS